MELDIGMLQNLPHGFYLAYKDAGSEASGVYGGDDGLLHDGLGWMPPGGSLAGA